MLPSNSEMLWHKCVPKLRYAATTTQEDTFVVSTKHVAEHCACAPTKQVCCKAETSLICTAGKCDEDQSVCLNKEYQKVEIG